MAIFDFFKSFFTNRHKQEYRHKEIMEGLEDNLYEIRQVRRLSLYVVPLLTVIGTSASVAMVVLLAELIASR